VFIERIQWQGQINKIHTKKKWEDEVLGGREIRIQRKKETKAMFCQGVS